MAMMSTGNAGVKSFLLERDFTDPSSEFVVLVLSVNHCSGLIILTHHVEFSHLL